MSTNKAEAELVKAWLTSSSLFAILLQTNTYWHRVTKLPQDLLSRRTDKKTGRKAVQVTLMCRRCGSEIHFEDLFCQECGLSQEKNTAGREFQANESADNFWPTMDADPLGSGDQHNYTNLFGQTYDFSNYQLDLEPEPDEGIKEPLESSATELVEPETVLEPNTEALPSGLEDAKLHSPIFDKADLADQKLGMRGGWGMVATDTAVVIAVLAFGLGLGFYAYSKQKTSAEKSRAAHSKTIEASVKTAAGKSDYKTVYRQLLPSRILGQLDEPKQILFNESAFRLGEQELQSGNPEKALEYFNQVSVESEHYVRARAIIFQHALPVVQDSKTAEKASTKPERKARIFKQVSNALESSPADLSEEPVLSIPVLEELKSTEGSPDTVISQTETSSNQSPESSNEATEPPTRKFSESEISQYNKLLGNHFRLHKQRSEKSPEPPSFKEWIKDGKPAF